jgi:GTP-binding protein Era
LELVKRDRRPETGDGREETEERSAGEQDGESEGARPVILVLNKIDKIHEKHQLLPLIDWYRQQYDFAEIIPLSALKGDAIDDLLGSIVKHLPEGEPIFDPDELTDMPLRTIVSEMVREKILTTTGEEIPYVTAVVTEKWDDSDPEITEIYCAIFVERSSQKPIIIGKGGSRIRDIGTEARRDIERLLGKKVFLKLFVKVVEDWRNRAGELDEMGIRE